MGEGGEKLHGVDAMKAGQEVGQIELLLSLGQFALRGENSDKLCYQHKIVKS